jgi:hypothetical protein
LVFGPLFERFYFIWVASRIRMDLQFYPDPAHKLSANMYDIYRRCAYSEKLLTTDRETVRNM